MIFSIEINLLVSRCHDVNNESYYRPSIQIYMMMFRIEILMYIYQRYDLYNDNLLDVSKPIKVEEKSIFMKLLKKKETTTTTTEHLQLF